MARCQAVLHIGDDFGDNHATMRCEREPHDKGHHVETFRNGTAVITWENDERDEWDSPNE